MQTCLHQACRHVPVARSFTALFSTSARRGNDSGDLMSHLSNMLGGVDYQRPQSTQQQYKTTPWVKVQPHRVLRPTELSYNSRAKTYKPFAKYQVAPPPSIARGNDVFYRLNLDPRSFTMNPEVLYQFVSGMGKIYPREQTMLTAKSQRLLAKTIRRAKQMGVMANLSRPRSSF